MVGLNLNLNLKPKPPSATTTDSTSGGMGLLLVLFPQDKSTTTSPPLISKSLLSKTQSTISICALLLFTTLLLFTLSTIPSTTTTSPSSSTPRRSILQKPTTTTTSHFALQRMGTLYRRGTRAMTDLVICHVADETPIDDFRLFLRLLHRSSLTASTDVVLIFSSPSSTSNFSPIVLQENQAFFSLLNRYSQLNRTHARNSTFRPTRFLHMGGQVGEPLWGPKSRSNFTGGRPKLSYGSVVSFDATELDPENSLAGFLDRVPLSLRRWACYPMLLGRLRRSNFKHVMLIDARSVLVLGDALGRVRNRSPESVLLFYKHGKKGQSAAQRGVSPTVVMGGARGVRRLASAVVVEIVRAATQHRKRKNPVSDSAVLSQLASNEFTLRNKSVRLIDSAESIPESGASSASSFSDYAIIQRGSGNHDLNSVIKKQMCSSVVDSSVYRDC